MWNQAEFVPLGGTALSKRFVNVERAYFPANAAAGTAVHEFRKVLTGLTFIECIN
jgi:hypothetical protein